MKKQNGYLMLLAVLFIVVIGFLGTALSFMFVGTSTSVSDTLQSNQAFYVAEGGLEYAVRQLLTSDLTKRTACSGLSISNSLGSGSYTVTGSGPNNVSSATSLSSDLTSSATTIPVASTAGYQSAGRIMIDQEMINYASITSTSFVGATRGVDGTLASSHSSGALVAQFQCNLTSQAGVPSLSFSSINLGGKRTLTEMVQLQDGWAVGNLLSGPKNWNMVRWNSPTELSWTAQPASLGAQQQLNSVSMNSNVDVWIVGNANTAMHFDGSTWTLIHTGIAGGDNLSEVSAVSSTEAWTCGSKGNVYKWSGGTSWTSTKLGGTLNAISMINTTGGVVADLGWIVGGTAAAFLYDGSSWTSKKTGLSGNLNDVVTLSATDAWTAGASGKVFQWNGTSWSQSSATSGQTLNGISMIKSGSSDIGWVVGNSSTAYFYDGSTWSSANSGLAGGLTLTAVITVSSNQAWLVDSAGDLYEWDGSTWTKEAKTSVGLNSIAMIQGNSKPISAWAESFA